MNLVEASKNFKNVALTVGEQAIVLWIRIQNFIYIYIYIIVFSQKEPVPVCQCPAQWPDPSGDDRDSTRWQIGNAGGFFRASQA